jgi:hypothetical protein
VASVSYLQDGNLDLVRSFFDSVIDVTMLYVIKSQGWGGGMDRNKEVCLLVSDLRAGLGDHRSSVASYCQVLGPDTSTLMNFTHSSVSHQNPCI